MSIESFYTAQNKSLQVTATTSANIPASGSFPVADFMEMFLQSLQDSNKTDDKKDPGSSLLQSKNPTLSKEPSLDPATLLADSDHITESVKLLKSFGTEITDTLSLNQQEMDDKLIANKPVLDDEELKDILNGFAIDSKGNNDGKTGSAQDILKRLQSITQDSDTALITANLTPEQISDLQEKIAHALIEKGMEKERAMEAAQEFGIAGFIQITKPQGGTETLYLAQSLGQGQNSRGLKAANDLSSRVNDLTAGDEDIPDDLRFKQFLEDLAAGNSGGKNPEEKGPVSLTSTDAQALQNSNTSPSQNVLQGWPFSLTGSLFSSSQSFDNYDDTGLSAVHNGHVNTLGSITNLVTQAHSATQPHPATQIVAATIQKAAASGETTDITLHLNPPDLGRVEVRMNFDKDKGLKTVIKAEKPETLAMLQRDVHVLERALHSTGMDTDAGISFELAGENYAFGQNGGHDEQHNGQSRSGGDDEDGIEILETTMNWSVDPTTGHTSYNILA